ncbi:SDR family NAD(P)-dependent oxidoreductase [Blastococcus sp. SYSU DS0619]
MNADQAAVAPGAGPVALVTGAADGIGLAVVERLLDDGYRVTASDISPTVHDRFSSPSDAGRVRTVVADMADPDSGRALVAETLDAFGRIDGLVNNAGVAGPAAATEQLDLDDVLRVLRVNVLGTVGLCQAAVPHLCAQGSGSIVNMGSLFAARPVPEVSAYCMSKAAVRTFSEALAIELGPHGVTVNTVAPGYILTTMHRASMARQAASRGIPAEAREAELRASVPLRRHGTGSDVAATVAWLLSPDASYITGQTIGVNGGVHPG